MASYVDAKGYDYDVVICGGGPTGLAMALGLVNPNMKVLLVDKETNRSTNTRTVAIWPRNIESVYLYSRDLYKRFADKASSVTQLTLAFGSQHCLQVPLESIKCNSRIARVPWYLFQRETEELLEQYALEQKDMPLVIRKGWYLEDAWHGNGQNVKESAIHLRIKELKADTTQEICTRYLIGCDGPGSMIRALSGVDLNLFPKQSAGWIVDGKLSFERRGSGPDIMAKGVAGNALFVSTSTGITGFFSLTDELTRVVLPVPMESVSTADRADPTVKEFNEKLAALKTHYLFQVYDVVSIKSYRFRFGLARAFNDRTGRVFLAGDSAHFHSPVGGQGMNLGMQDAFNLSWKISMCIRNPDVVDAVTLLSSYDSERRPLAEKVVKRTYATTSYFFMRHFQFAWWIWAQIIYLAYRFALPKGLTVMSQLGSNYAGSALCASDWRRRKWYYLWDRSGVAAGHHVPLTEVKTHREETVFLASLCDREGFSILYFPPNVGRSAYVTSAAPLLGGSEADSAWSTFRDRLESYKFRSLISKVVVVISSTQDCPASDRSGFYSDLILDEKKLVKVQWVEDIDSRVQFVGDSADSCMYVIRPDYFVGFRSRPFRLQSLCDWFAKFTLDS